MKIFQIIFILYSLITTTFVSAQEHIFKEKFHVKGEDTLQYRIMYPENFSEEETYPVVLFLHGAGERGNDNKKQLVHGSKLFTDKTNRDSFPAIVIFPQCPKNDYWSKVDVDRSTKPIGLKFEYETGPTTAMALVLDLMDELAEKSFVKKEKIYVGGLSMGGMGTFEILSRRPDMFAAAFAICGGGDPESVKEYANTTSLWVFHGAKDDVVDPQLSIDMVSGILKYGGKPNFTLYADDNHNSWDSAFAEPELLKWLFSKSKK
ncbi:phospholipase [Winogradskyella sp. J14-2]|uniref:carboxylesterase family protein n=1 Tax=Winogradskyella sp. J14-2 TaxID=1936080 RepID=UPI000972C0DE|nr:prolyl oligopeptidase family serine peptidase [Winogradskyella sp. J14-2]APY09417.1 phospholipase [Winogradskyella sp. J14-2]